MLGRDDELDHGATLLWGLYLYDSFGQGQATDILDFWLNGSAQGIEGFESVLRLTDQENPTFGYELHQWVQYNFIGKEPYAYLSAPVPVFSPTVIQEHPKEKMISISSFGGQSVKINVADVGDDPLEIVLSVEDHAGLKASYWIDRGVNPQKNEMVDIGWSMTDDPVKLTLTNLSGAVNVRLFFSYAAPGDYKEVTVNTRIVTDEPVDGDSDEEIVENVEDEVEETSSPGDEDDPAETTEEEKRFQWHVFLQRNRTVCGRLPASDLLRTLPRTGPFGSAGTLGSIQRLPARRCAQSHRHELSGDYRQGRPCLLHLQKLQFAGRGLRTGFLRHRSKRKNRVLQLPCDGCRIWSGSFGVVAEFASALSPET